jgi:hypothetical protein
MLGLIRDERDGVLVIPSLAERHGHRTIDRSIDGWSKLTDACLDESLLPRGEWTNEWKGTSCLSVVWRSGG